MLDWLVVGGGVHGTHLSLSLLRRNQVAPDRVRVLDPHPEPLHAWRQRCAVTGMTQLRSPAVHHLGLNPKGLRRFAGRRQTPRGTFQSVHQLPSLEVFSRHCNHVIHQHRLEDLRLRGSARSLQLHDDRVCVETEDGLLEARRAVLALGPPGLHWPTWARDARRDGAPVEHSFATGYTCESLPATGDLLVVGGGQSAVQLALNLAAEHPGRVTLLSRHDWRVAEFDAEPTWIGTGLRRFQDLNCERKRRTLLSRARRDGSVTSREFRRFRREVDRGRVRRVVGEVEAWSRTEDGLSLTLKGTGETLESACVLLATGFCQAPPGGAWLWEAADAAGLQCAPCGYPRVDELLRWHPRLHLAGALAELELGPLARNIAGGRLAAERLERMG